MDDLSKYLDYLKFEKRVSAHTITAYTTDLQQFFNYTQTAFQVNDLAAIDAPIIRTWIITLMEEGDSTRSINRKISALRSFFNYHIKIKSLEHNPMKQVTAPKIAKRLPYFVEENDMERLFSADLFPDTFEGWRDRTIIELFYATGMRLTELINIKKDDIDLYESTVKVLGKRNKERIIPFGNTMEELLIKYLDLCQSEVKNPNENFFIFFTPKSNKMYPKAVYNIVHKYLDMATTIGKRSPHVIRHTFATHMLNHGADINAIKEILGHANLAATQVYTHNSIEKLKSVYKHAHPRA